VLDVREHACCLDDKNLRAKFVEAFWSLVSWEEANRRFTALLKGVTM
jgi:superoxide dismutase, Fe-Mn family